jgi:hypothetical protein
MWGNGIAGTHDRQLIEADNRRETLKELDEPRPATTRRTSTRSTGFKLAT